MRVLMVIVILTTAGRGWSQVVQTQCPPQWIPWQSFCYLFINSSSVSWNQANAECRSRQAHLLRIETQDEYDFVKKNLVLYTSDSYWTALNDLPMNQGDATKSSFMWDNDEFPIPEVVANHWDREPNNTPDKDCVQVSIQATLSFDVCDFRHSYICEIPKLDESVACPDSWIYGFEDSKRCYFISSDDWAHTVTWDDARKQCESMTPFNDNVKAMLLAINNENVQTFIGEKLPTVHRTRQVFWTGLNDRNTEGTLIWTGSTDNVYNANYVTWRIEPNNLGGREFCGAIMRNGAWTDSNCEDRKNFICRIALNAPNLYNYGCGQWSRAGQSCVYVYSSPLGTWQDARSFCQAQGGDLYKYYNEDDALWLKTQAQSILTLPGYYIGLNDQQTENTFVWADGSTSDSSLLDWDMEPNDNGMGTGAENCAMMSVAGDFTSTTCSLVHSGTICEEKLGQCYSGWQSYSGSCYFFDANWKTHDEGINFCKQQSQSGNASLVAINTQEEKTFILNKISSMQPSAPYQWWTDLTRSAGDTRDWHWSRDEDNDPKATETLVTWNKEPNDYNKNEDCVQVDVNGHLNDVNCNSKSGFICQRVANAAVLKKPLWALLPVLYVTVFWLPG